MSRRAFTLLELLVAVAVIAVLAAVLLPSLSAAREQAKRVICATRLAQLARGFHMYAGEFRGRVMPLWYAEAGTAGGGAPVFWWGTNDAAGVDHTRGFLWPYLASELRHDGLYECPRQPWGTYVPQGSALSLTSTYGYNGYYLSPANTPGWSSLIGHRPWQNVDVMKLPQRVFSFADTALDTGGDLSTNAALLDPPMLFQTRGRWRINGSPTTSFRHGGKALVGFVDGHVDVVLPAAEALTSPHLNIGSASVTNDPGYVPDWESW
ncbi:MAG: hypothetical protein CHACPFDD_01354 [Phycisphaerae bacterium]|nr:hypothetical protein [Phycisphaerae bacterium]